MNYDSVANFVFFLKKTSLNYDCGDHNKCFMIAHVELQREIFHLISMSDTFDPVAWANKKGSRGREGTNVAEAADPWREKDV